MNKRGSALKTIVIIFSLLVLIALFSVIMYKIFKGGVEEEYDVSLKIAKDSVNVTSNKVSLTISREKGDDIDLAQIKFVLFDGENLEEIILNASDLKQSGSKSFTFTSKNLSKITKISIIPIVKAKGENKSLKVSDSVKITYGKDNKIEVQQEKAFCGNKKKDTGEECDDGNLKAGDGCSTLCKLESCATQKGYLCASGKICPGTSLTSSNSGVCCKVACITETKTKTITCGDGVCNGNETYSTCSKDCVVGCGNNVCDSGETCSTCENDCGTCCGNNVINSGEQCDNGTLINGQACTASYNQNCTYCSNTCQNTIVHGKYCGDNLCDSGETSGTCLVDCSGTCGNSVINSGEQCDSGTNNGKNCTASYNQNCTYCSNACLNITLHGKYCGDGLCDSGETHSSCSKDCGVNWLPEYPCGIAPSSQYTLTDNGGNTCTILFQSSDKDCSVHPWATYAWSYLTVTNHNAAETAWRTLVYFDLSAIPDVTINTATMTLYGFQSFSGRTPMTVNCHRVTSNWNEGSSWSSITFASNVLDSIGIGSSGSDNTNYIVDVTTTVRDFVSSNYDNYGFILKPSVEGTGDGNMQRIDWKSRRNSDSSHRPKLSITYQKEV